ncbi:hypothetical protein OVA24_12655 [Luteolibacter sp. SL250]|uniref:hypothetical protein n=1 Tax=Luteolibacter sp. SL250 TaxID=2995170 RepID=UPI00227141B7|nr:hypothetical protein [Luteolibacter sp. SL250]WAC18088.1 hypothetical protein OVA24_12655 [Luteolibacter sp. SL250]
MRSISQWLRCEESGGPFTHCVCCRLPLREIAAPWLVNKDYHREECVLEYAICQPCRDVMSEKFSEGSKETVRNFLEKEVDWDERQREFMLMLDEAERLEACISCRKGREDCEGFSISFLFDSDGNLVAGPLPLLICNGCIARMMAGVSPESRAVWRHFIADHFDGPPTDEGMEGFGLF